MRWHKAPPSGEIPLWVAVIWFPIWGPALLIFYVLLWAVMAKRWLLGPREEWEPWFAWRPVLIRSWDGQDDKWAWFERIERRSSHPLADTEYDFPAQEA